MNFKPIQIVESSPSKKVKVALENSVSCLAVGWEPTLISFCPILIQRTYQTPVSLQIPLSLLLPLKSAF